MNISRLSFTIPATVAWVCLSTALYPVDIRAQQSPRPRNHPAATPTATPSPTPPIISAVPVAAEPREPALPASKTDGATVTETEIDATDGATFASKERIAVFTGNVRVTDPRFQLACDKLTVFLNKSASTDTPAVPAAVGGTTPPPAGESTPPPLAGSPTPPPGKGKAASAPAPGAPAAPSGGGGIDHASAEGHVIILQKRAPTKPGEEEKVSIGRGDKGTFDNKTGDMVLYGMPEIEQNGNSHAATSPDTVMTIHKDSSLDTKGPSKTILIQHKGSSGIEMPGVPAAPTNSPGGKPKKKANGASSPQPSATPQG